MSSRTLKLSVCVGGRSDFGGMVWFFGSNEAGDVFQVVQGCRIYRDDSFERLGSWRDRPSISFNLREWWS